jgi:G:T-mismatch repair DNA endonuclease (very short patch repair protein)
MVGKLRRSKLMRRVESEYGRSLEDLLPEMINEIGFSETAEQILVNKATLGYWLLKLGINVRRVALRPGESLEIRRTQE